MPHSVPVKREQKVTIRKLLHGDVNELRSILQKTDVFSEEEVATALELMDVFLNDPNQQDYDMYTALTASGEVAGYVCLGPRPLTKGTFDLYWIAVKPSVQNLGIGKELSNFAERVVKSQGGRLLLAETSSLEKYENTRRFYLRRGYQEVARIIDYYTIGDDLVVYGKYVSQ